MKMIKAAFWAALGLGVVSAHAVTITSGAFIGSGGAGTGQGLAGDRFRSFQPTGGSENFLGVPDLGTAGNRSEQNLAWMTDLANPLTSFGFTFQYDQANDRLSSTIFGGTITWANWSSSLASRGKTKGAADLNAFQISVTLRDASSNVYLTDLVLDGISLGGLNGSSGTTVNELITGSDMNLTDGFTLTGKLWLQGAFSTSQEASAVNLTAGWDSRGSAPSVPDGGFTLVLLGGAVTGAALLRRKLAQA